MEFYYSDVDNDVLIIKADGGLNSDNASEFVDKLVGLIDAGQSKIIVDCSNLNIISSSGLGVLKIGGDVKLACVKGMIEQVLTITRLNSIFEIYPDVNRACLMFRPKDTDQ